MKTWLHGACIKESRQYTFYQSLSFESSFISSTWILVTVLISAQLQLGNNETVTTATNHTLCYCFLNKALYFILPMK